MPIAVTEYQDVIYRTTKTTGIVFNTNPTGSGLANDGRLLDLYEPSSLLFTNSLGGAGAAPVATSRPLLIFVHGGGYTQGTRSNGEAQFICEQFASRGWRSLSIDYRMSSVLLWPQSIIMGVEDTRAALRWARANAATYLFDTTKIVVAGSSAGGGLSIFSALGNTSWETNNGSWGSYGAPTVPNGILAFWPDFRATFGLDPTTHNANAALGRCDKSYVMHGTSDVVVPIADSFAYDFVVRSNSPSNVLALQQLQNAPHECWEAWPSPNIKNSNSNYYEDAAAAIPKAAAYFKTQFGL